MTIPNLVDGEQRVYFKSGGEWCYLWTPKTFKVKDKIPILVHNHGAGGYIKENAADWPDTDWKASVLKSIMKNVIAVAEAMLAVITGEILVLSQQTPPCLKT